MNVSVKRWPLFQRSAESLDSIQRNVIITHNVILMSLN